MNKEETRKKILDATRKELLAKGVELASMRTIAASAEMTVGNLYRYFESKEDMILEVMKDTLNKLDVLMYKVSERKVSHATHVFSLRFNMDELRDLFDLFVDGLFILKRERSEEFMIMLFEDSYLERVEKWIKTWFYKLIESNSSLQGEEALFELLSSSYTSGLIASMRHLFSKGGEDDVLRVEVKALFHSYLYMLDNDYRRFLA